MQIWLTNSPFTANSPELLSPDTKLAALHVNVPMSHNSTLKTVRVLFLIVGLLYDICDSLYLIVFVVSTGAPLKYQLMLGIGVPVAWQVNKAVSPSFRVWSTTPIFITVLSWEIKNKMIVTRYEPHSSYYTVTKHAADGIPNSQLYYYKYR